MAASTPGKGSEFSFTAGFQKQSDVAEGGQVTPGNLHGVRVLVVDDNITNREILMIRLSAWGMCPFEAEDGPSAISVLARAVAEKKPFDLAVIDMQMPGMDGEELGRAIQADPLLGGTRMVMLTSLGARGDAQKFADLGFVGYLAKPVRHKELQRILSLALSTEDESSPVPGPLITRHTAREQYPGFQGCKARILLAEDNITNQQVALGILKKLGLTADAVANGREAIEALRMLPYDLVLMDVQMPELDGLEATRQIRNPLSQVNNPRIPVIAMTAHAMQGDKNKCLEAGMNDYVTKPVNPQTLAGVLEKWLPENSRGGRQIPVSGLGKEDKVYEETSTSSTTFAKAEPDYQPVQPVFDRSFVLGLLMGDEQLAEKILQGFLEDIPRQIKVLGEYLTAGDCERAERQAHTIKGASANVGAESLRVLASKAERAGKMGDLDAMKELLKDLTTSFEELKKSI